MKMGGIIYSKLNVILAASCILFCSWNIENEVVTIYNANEITQCISYTNTFATKLKTPIYTHTYSLNGYDIYKYIVAVKCHSVAIYNGYDVEGVFTNENKVFIVAPLDASMKIMQQGQCLKYKGYKNMSITEKKFSTENTNPVSLNNLPYISPIEAKRCINSNSKSHQNDNIRGFVLQRSTLDKVIKNNTAAVLFNMRIHHGFNNNNNRILLATAINYFTGLNQNDYTMQLINSASLCPTNCDFY
jgi:hypothetical protein